MSDDMYGSSFYVTDYAAIYRIRNNTTEIVVTDRKSGKPAKGVQVNMYIGTRGGMRQAETIQKVGTLKTDQLGIILFNSNTNNTYYFSTSCFLQRGCTALSFQQRSYSVEKQDS